MKATLTEREGVVVIDRGRLPFLIIYPSYLRGKICGDVQKVLDKTWKAECEICENKNCIIPNRTL